MNNKYWWVNHKKTLKQEISGGYIWSPKKNKNNARNKTYENLENVCREILFIVMHSKK